jgi:hypothetical protein
MKDLPLTAKAVRVSIPASVAGDLGGLKKSFASILDRLGCPNCCSGYDIRMELQRELALSKSLRDKARIGGWAGAARDIPRVSVGVKPSAVNSLGEVNEMLERIAGMTGHPACATGCDLWFRMEELFVIDQNLEIEAPVLRVG